MRRELVPVRNIFFDHLEKNIITLWPYHCYDFFLCTSLVFSKMAIIPVYVGPIKFYLLFPVTNWKSKVK